MQASQPNKKIRPVAIVGALLVLAAAAFAVITGVRNWDARSAARKLKNPVPATSESLAAGQKLYKMQCERCHGEKGDGKGEKAYELSVAPGDFTDIQKMARVTDGELYWQITKGRLPMPSFETKVSDEGRWELVNYIRTFAGKPMQP